MNTEGIEQKIDGWLNEILRGTTAIRNAPSADQHFLFGYLDRWNEIRGQAFLLWVRLSRLHHEAKKLYDDQMRDHLYRGARRGQSDFTSKEERFAVYETKTLSFLQDLRRYERVMGQLDAFRRFAQEMGQWVNSKIINLQSERKQEQYISNEQITPRD